MSHEDIESQSHPSFSETPISLSTISEDPSLTWDSRVCRAISAGQSAKDKFLGVPSCEYCAPKLELRDRYFVIILGRDCSHSGFTDRKCVASSHCNPASLSRDPRLIPSPSSIVHGFPSLREARAYWNEVFPDSSLEHLPSVCDHLPASEPGWLIL